MSESFTVSADAEGTRLDKFLCAQRPDLSRAFVQNLITQGNVRVDNLARKPNYAVRAGQCVAYEIPAPAPSAAQPEAIALDILFQDDALLVINKAAGMVVHPAAGHHGGTVVNAVLGYAPEIVTGNEERPGIVHRLDRDTSGVLLVAKTDAALHNLQKQFAARAVHKTYLAMVVGDVQTPQGKIDAPIARDLHDRKKMAIASPARGRDAVTLFHVLARSLKYSLLRLEPESGRTHQLRVHLAFLKHPVVADAVYGKKKNDLGLERQFLHAWRIEFAHPTNAQPLKFTAPLPQDLNNAIQRAGFDASQVLV